MKRVSNNRKTKERNSKKDMLKALKNKTGFIPVDYKKLDRSEKPNQVSFHPSNPEKVSLFAFPLTSYHISTKEVYCKIITIS